MHENWDTWRTKRGVIVAGQLTPEQAMVLTHGQIPWDGFCLRIFNQV